MDFNLVDQLTLLALDDHKGTFVTDTISYGYSVGGAVILELALAEKLAIVDHRVKVIDKTATGNAILDEQFQIIKGKNKEKKLTSWIESIGNDSEKIKKATIQQLVDKGILEKREEKFLWVFNVKKFPTSDPRPENALRSNLRQIVIDYHKADLRDIILLNLIKACNLEKEVFGKSNVRLFKQRMKEINAQNELAKEVSKSIAEVCEAVNAVLIVLITTAIASTTVINN